jgi:hypothetical protein
VTHWRYQPVIIDDEGTVALCEAYFDADRRLERWTDPAMYPQGDGMESLTNDIVRMLVDSYSWHPVPFATLTVGMRFEAAITLSQRESIARLVTAIAKSEGK